MSLILVYYILSSSTSWHFLQTFEGTTLAVLYVERALMGKQSGNTIHDTRTQCKILQLQSDITEAVD